MKKNNIRITYNIFIISTSIMLFFACNRKDDSHYMRRRMERESDNSNDNRAFSKKRRNQESIVSEAGESNLRREPNRNHENSETGHNDTRRDTNRDSEFLDSERDNSSGACDKICNKCTKICCFCCILDPSEQENEDEEDDEDEVMLTKQSNDDLENEQDNPLKMLSDYISSYQKQAYMMTGKGNFKIKIKPHKANILENETKYWKNKITINGRSLYPPIPPLRKNPFIPATDNRLLSYIKPQTCKEIEDFLDVKKKLLGAVKKKPRKNNIFSTDSELTLERSRLSKKDITSYLSRENRKSRLSIENKKIQRRNQTEQEDSSNPIIDFIVGVKDYFTKKDNGTMENISTEEYSSEDDVNKIANSHDKLIFCDGLSYDIIDKELKEEKAHYTLSIFSKKNKLVEGSSPPTLLEAITILQQDSLLNDPKFSDMKIYTSTSYNLPGSSSSIAVKYDSKNRNYIFYLTNPKGRENNIKILPIIRIEENPIDDVCCESCTIPVFCCGQTFVRPTYMCYICYSPSVYHCGKVRLRGCNCSISNLACCYCPNLPCCIYPTSSTCWDRHSCPLCCFDPGCKACCLCNPGCTFN